MRVFIAALGLICLCSFGAMAETDMPRQIAVTGEGRVESPPDMALFTLGVTHEARGAKEAMDETSAAVAQILTRLNALGLEGRDVQTQQVTLSPIWSNHRDNSDKPPKIVGFVAANTIAIRVRDLPKLGGVLDAVLEDGANTFGGLMFSVQDPEPLMNRAREQAVQDAMARAALLAKAAGVALGRVQSITDHGGGRGPVMMEMAAGRSSDVPIAAGEISLSASVSMVFGIAED